MTKIYLRKDAAVKQEENKKGYMGELEDWIEHTVIEPLYDVWFNPEGSTESEEAAVTTVRKAIKDKVLESYHNGLAAKPRQSGGGEHRRYGAR